MDEAQSATGGAPTSVAQAPAISVAPAPRSGFRPDIQGLRGLAVLLVVLYHTNTTITGGFIGVDVFFVLSGFVITGLLVRESRRSGSVRLGTFFTRRVRRLLPMLAVTLTATALLGVFLLSPLGASETTGKTATAAALINANTFLARQAQDYFGLAPTANALLHTWSLSVEEQFYLVFPLLVLGGLAVRRRRGRGSRPAAAGALGLVAVASFALYALLLGGHLDGVATRFGFSSGQAVAFYSAPSRAWEFLAGSILAILAPRLVRVPRLVVEVAGLAGLASIVVAGVIFTDSAALSPPQMLIPVIATTFVIAAGIGPSTSVSRLLSLRGLVWLGDLSYGWYLLHWPLIVFAAATFFTPFAQYLAAGGSLLLALVTKRNVEDRFRYDNRLRGRRVAAFAAVCILLPVIAGVGAVVASRALAINDLTQANARHIDSAHCNRRQAEAVPIDADICTWEAENAKGRIVLIGDSHASMWSEAVIAAGNDLGYDVSIATMSGCPTIGGSVTRMRDGAPDVECREFIDRSIDDLIDLRPDLVMLASASNGLVTQSVEDERWQRADGTWVEDVDGWTSVVEEGLKDAARPLEAAGIRTLIVRDVPYHSDSNAECSWIRYRVSPTACASTRDRAAVDAELARSRGAETRAADAVGAATLDPVPWLCDDQRCSTFGRETWLYRDDDHISVAASTALASDMRSAFEGLGL